MAASTFRALNAAASTFAATLALQAPVTFESRNSVGDIFELGLEVMNGAGEISILGLESWDSAGNAYTLG